MVMINGFGNVIWTVKGLRCMLFSRFREIVVSSSCFRRSLHVSPNLRIQSDCVHQTIETELKKKRHMGCSP